jgi:LysM repeat protein
MPPQDGPAAVEPTPVTPAPVFQTPTPAPVEETPEVMDWEGGDVYVVQKGDMLSKVAARYKVSVREIAELNDLKDPNNIRAGQKLVMPAHSSYKAPPKASKPVASPAAPRNVAPGGTYVVQSGDTLSGIASRHGCKVGDIKALNNLKSDKILIGQKLTIPDGAVAPASRPAAKPAPKPVVSSPMSAVTPSPAPALTAPPPVVEEIEEEDVVIADEPIITEEHEFEYIVAEGDTLESVARDFVVLKADLMRVNNLSETAELRPGQPLIIPIPVQ